VSNFTEPTKEERLAAMDAAVKERDAAKAARVAARKQAERDEREVYGEPVSDPKYAHKTRLVREMEEAAWSAYRQAKEEGRSPSERQTAIMRAAASVAAASGNPSALAKASQIAIEVHIASQYGPTPEAYEKATAEWLDGLDVIEGNAGPDSWEYIDAVKAGGRAVEAPFLGGVIYAASRHSLSGPSGCGKSWGALYLVALELLDGQTVIYLDTDDMGPARFLARLRALGVDDEAISERFLLVRPERAATDEALARMVETIKERGVRLVVVDSWNPALGLEGLDPLVTRDLDVWLTRFAKPINEAGAALLTVDHVPKGSDGQRGGYAYGSERKRSGVTVHLSMKMVEPFGFGKVGRALLTIEKDRDGMIGPQGTAAGMFEMWSSRDGSKVEAQIGEATERDEEGNVRRTYLMQKVSEYLEGHDEPVSRTTVVDEAGVGSRTEYVRQALDQLVREGYVSEIAGAREGWRSYLSLKEFRAFGAVDEEGSE
jgi:hypothetical protein